MKSILTIMHTESHRQWGGQERRVFNESRWMHLQGHKVIIVAPQLSPLFEKAGQQGWETYAVGFNKFGMIKDACLIRRLLGMVRPDVLNTHGNTDSKVALFAAWGLGIPCVVRTRHSTPAVSNSWYNRLLYQRLCQHIFTTADCISRQLHRDLGVTEDRITTVSSGIECPDSLMDHEPARRKLAAEIGVENNQRFIGFVGRLSSEKGLPLLIDAFGAVKDNIPDHHLAIVGDGEVAFTLKKQIDRQNLERRVHLLGYRDDPWPFFRAFDCHILASAQYEGVPQSVLQAMFAQCPVIGTDVGGIPDIIRHDQTGLLVPPNDPGRLAEAILRSIKDADATRKRVEKAFQSVITGHTLETMGQKILQVYARYLPEL